MLTALGIVRHFFPKVKKVSDADENVTIEVTERDSNSAHVKDHNACALAVACKRQLGLTGVIISTSRVYLIRRNQATRYLVPPSVAREIVSFDRKAGFAEGQYRLCKPAKTSRLGRSRGGGSSTQSRSGQKYSRFVHMTADVRSVLGGRKRPEHGESNRER
jgi:hypothetical protein